MYDRPTLPELIAAARLHLETAVLPITRGVHHKLYFQTLVAINVLRVAERQIALGAGHFRAEWTRLDMLTGIQALPDDPDAWQAALTERNVRLCAEIRAGMYDDNRALFAHLVACATEQLEVANPKWLSAL